MMNQALPARALIAVEGADAQIFLHSLLTQTIAAPEAGAVQYAAMLSPQGKISFDAFVIGRGSQGYWLDVAEDRAEMALAKLSMFRLRRAVTLAPAPQWRAIWAKATGAGDLCLPDPRLPDGAAGVRIYRQGGEIAAPAYTLGDRLHAGLPDLAADAGLEEVFGLEALLEELSGVDFHKGCFPGQENVSRMKRRATTRRKFCRVLFDGPALTPGAIITAGAAELGYVRQAVDGVGLAMLRLDRVQEAAAGGAPLMCEGRAISVAAPAWLLWPSEKSAD